MYFNVIFLVFSILFLNPLFFFFFLFFINFTFIFCIFILKFIFYVSLFLSSYSSFVECHSYFMSLISVYLPNRLTIVSFLVFSSSCTVSFLQASVSFLFVWDSLLPKTFFRYPGILSCLPLFKSVKSQLKILYMCFGICCWLWASLQYHLTGLFLFLNPMLYIFIFLLVLIGLLKGKPLDFLPAPGSWRYRLGYWSQWGGSQGSHHSVYKLSLNAPIFLVNPPPPLNCVWFSLLSASSCLNVSLLFGGGGTVASMQSWGRNLRI